MKQLKEAALILYVKDSFYKSPVWTADGGLQLEKTLVLKFSYATVGHN